MNIRIVDVRRPREFAAGHIGGSELVPLRDIAPCQQLLGQVSTDRDPPQFKHASFQTARK